MFPSQKNINTWLKISYIWVFQGQRNYVRNSINTCQSITDLYDLESKLFIKYRKSHPNHWAVKEFNKFTKHRIHELFYGK